MAQPVNEGLRELLQHHLQTVVKETQAAGCLKKQPGKSTYQSRVLELMSLETTA